MVQETKKPNCYDCKWKGNVPGSAHICCEHPAFQKAHDDPAVALLSIFASVQRVPPMQAHVEGITVKGNEHGIKSGWFNHPWNFDPTWLESCDGFEVKED